MWRHLKIISLNPVHGRDRQLVARRSFARVTMLHGVLLIIVSEVKNPALFNPWPQNRIGRSMENRPTKFGIISCH